MLFAANFVYQEKQNKRSQTEYVKQNIMLL